MNELVENHNTTMQENDTLKELCCSHAEQAQEYHAVSLSRHEGNGLENELQESRSAVNHLTVQIQELQECISSLNEVRDEDFEIASSSGRFTFLANH